MNRHETFNWQGVQGGKIFAQAWTPQQVRGAVVLVHGLGEHSTRYTHVARACNDRGLAMVAFDLPGHGRSEGKRGHSNYDNIAAEIDRLLAETRQRYPGKPIFLYGHSMGASLVLYYTLKKKPMLQGIIATSPGLTIQEVSKTKVLSGKLLHKLYPSFLVKSGLNPNHISRDTTVVSAYQKDPLVHDSISVALGWDLLYKPAWILEHAAQLHMPLLLVHGSADQICLSSGSQAFAARAPADLVTYQCWEGLYHETHNDPEKEEVIAFTLNWIIQRLPVENGILASA